MKILQINKYFYPKGGAESVFFNTIDLLKEHKEDVFCLCLKNPENYPSDNSSYFIDYPELSQTGFWGKLNHIFSFFYNREARKKIEQLIIKEKPDIAHIHLLFNGISVSILPVLKKYHIPIIMTAHDYRLICPAYLLLDEKKQVCERCRKGNYFNCVLRKCHNNSRLSSAFLCLDMYFRNLFYPITKYVDKFIFVSDFSFEKHCSFNAKYREKGIRFYNWVKPEKLPFDRDISSARYFLYYGRLSREKGIGTLIEAVRGLNITLKIAGRGPLLENYKTNTPQNVEIVGFKSGEELRDLIKNAYFVIIPSEWYETFGLTTMEPQVWGVPVIGAKIGAIPELITNNETGYLFQSGNVSDLTKTIEKANNCSAEQYQKMSLNARKNATQFSNSEEYYNALMDIYKSAAENK